jgi:Fe-only nitrogenase accessory protein AnfO
MKVAAYLNANGVPVSLYHEGMLYVYEEDAERDASCWLLNRTLPFVLDSVMSLAQVKASVAGVVDALGQECRVLLSGEVRGLPYSVLQEQYEFRTWKSEGEVQQQLDFVRDREAELCMQRKFELVLNDSQQMPAPILVAGGGPGHYWIDLRAALEHVSNPTSRNILIPFFKGGRFTKLEILCGHLPKWMAWEIEQLDLAAESEPIDATGDGLRVTVYSRQMPEGRKRLVGLAGAQQVLSLPCPRSRVSHGPEPVDRVAVQR